MENSLQFRSGETIYCRRDRFISAQWPGSRCVRVHKWFTNDNGFYVTVYRLTKCRQRLNDAPRAVTYGITGPLRSIVQRDLNIFVTEPLFKVTHSWGWRDSKEEENLASPLTKAMRIMMELLHPDLRCVDDTPTAVGVGSKRRGICIYACIQGRLFDMEIRH